MTNLFTPLYAPLAETELGAVVSRAFGPQAHLNSCHPASSGLFNTSYVIETSHPRQKAVLRVAPSNQAVLVNFEKTMMAAEPAIYAMMRQAGAPIPEVLFIDTTRRVIPRDYIILEYVDAVPMNDPSVPESAKPALRRELGRYTRCIHRVRGARFGWPEPDGAIRGADRWDRLLWEFFQELCRRNVAAQAMRKDEASLIESLWKDQAGIFQANLQPCLVHNDLWEPNILVRQDAGGWRIAALIDGDRAMFADPEFEFALWSNDPDVMAGYGIPLGSAPAAILRRNWYKLCLALMNLYVYKVEYLDEENCQKTTQWAHTVLAEIQQARDFSS